MLANERREPRQRATSDHAFSIVRRTREDNDSLLDVAHTRQSCHSLGIQAGEAGRQSIPMRPTLASAVLLTLAACSGNPPPSTATTTTEVRATPEALARARAEHDQRMAWWREARFGMFVHWGLYAIPAGAWNGRTHHGESIRDTARIPLEEYDRLQAQWNPTAFDADQWARLAKAAGMNYLVVTSKHHDGFCLYPSRFTDWSVAHTKSGVDVLAALAKACERHGVRFCT